jgi:hypothetical protein
MMNAVSRRNLFDHSPGAGVARARELRRELMRESSAAGG